MKDLKWPQVTVILAVLLAVTVMTWRGMDSAVWIAAVIAALGALGFVVKGQAEVKEQSTAVAQQSNGNTEKLLDIIRSQQDQIHQLANKLAEMTPPPR